MTFYSWRPSPYTVTSPSSGESASSGETQPPGACSRFQLTGPGFRGLGGEKSPGFWCGDHRPSPPAAPWRRASRRAPPRSPLEGTPYELGEELHVAQREHSRWVLLQRRSTARWILSPLTAYFASVFHHLGSWWLLDTTCTHGSNLEHPAPPNAAPRERDLY